ncbi:hypothetical protein EBR61_01910 [bacterium]|jgi:hypothetical protein|nr:hypothetical protein [bacterium]
MTSLIEDKEILTKEELDYIDDNIINGDLPWFYQDCSTSKKFPFYSHTIVPRYNLETESPKVNSKLYYFFYDILEKFCDKHNLELNRVLRMSLNSNHSCDFSDHSDIHIDHIEPHHSVIIYLNDDFDGGRTFVLDKFYCEGMKVHYDLEEDISDFNIMYAAEAEKGKVLCFNGHIFHAVEWPKSNKRRVVCVITFD